MSHPAADRGQPVTGGPRWYRDRLRRLGAPVALLPPVLLGGLSLIVTRLFDSRLTGLAGLLGTLLAAPGLLVMGAPFARAADYVIAIGISAVIWLLVGLVAARRSTRNPAATWPDYWRQYAWMAGGLAVGTTVALIVSATRLGDSLL